jgi:hypothetical protein
VKGDLVRHGDVALRVDAATYGHAMRGVLLALVVTLVACAVDDDSATETTTSTIASETTTAPPATTAVTTTTTAAAPLDVEPGTGLYDDPASWLCRPDTTNDACDGNLDVTLVNADGSLTVAPFVVNSEPPIDCFYVYPTTSEDASPNSDLFAGAESSTALTQVGRFASTCRLFAPIYRQVTVAGLVGTNDVARGDWNTAYADVLDAWRSYLVSDNGGRGVVLIGHSQGSGHLVRLLREEVDPSESQRALLVSALLLGAPVVAPDGALVGGDLQHIPACTTDTEVGCVVTYATFAGDAPPGDDSLFGHSRGAPGRALCVDPAGLTGASLDTILPTDAYPVDGVSTPFVRFVDWIDASCVRDGRFDYLSVTKQPDAPAASPALDGRLGDAWGLHIVDVNIALGTLVELVASQSAAW